MFSVWDKSEDCIVSLPYGAMEEEHTRLAAPRPANHSLAAGKLPVAQTRYPPRIVDSSPILARHATVLRSHGIWSDYSPTTNRAGRRRWSACFLGDLPFAPPLHSVATPYLPHFTLIESQDLDVKSAQTYLKTKRRVGGPGQLAYRLSEPGSIPGMVDHGFSLGGIVLDDTADGRVFSGISRFPLTHMFLVSSLMISLSKLGHGDWFCTASEIGLPLLQSMMQRETELYGRHLLGLHKSLPPLRIDKTFTC
ncbi:hypothetical protein PR048_006159 [Dryococelus australis]|uniref:Uncharacterized protein n=1 Tax=Dryococelus australis TaxID=614101 RepID=A0ABQ9IBE7_9NEOP|nr:hypothetical protein PR048_006159 [Dryococelus australis]